MVERGGASEADRQVQIPAPQLAHHVTLHKSLDPSVSSSMNRVGGAQ